MKLGSTEETWYRSKDGRQIQGWIVKPPGFDPAVRYPLLLYIHGGPHSMYGVGFNHEFQVHAARGYLVLFTIPRGSSGYGQEFGNLVLYDYPGADSDDLMAGVDEVIGRGHVDRSRLAVTGGGLLTAWVVGRTDRFAVAASQYPSIDWFSMVLTTNIPYTIMSRFNKWPWEAPAEYMKPSPIAYVDRVKTPTMLITGEADTTTPISQSEEFYRALKLLKVPTVLVRVPGEGHGINGSISHRVAKMLYLTAWFDKYIRRNDGTR